MISNFSNFSEISKAWMLNSVFKGTFTFWKHRFDVHFPAKIRSVVPSTTAASGIITDVAPDLRKNKLYVGAWRSKTPMTSSAVDFTPTKYRAVLLRPKVPTDYTRWLDISAKPANKMPFKASWMKSVTLILVRRTTILDESGVKSICLISYRAVDESSLAHKMCVPESSKTP